jgi:hypothetical protein
VLVSNTIIMYFVSYDFLDPNVLKRRYRFNLIFVILCRAIEIFLYFLNLPMVIYIKYFLSHLIGFIFIYDWLKHLPFKDKGINLMYGCSIFIYESIMIIYSFWEIWPTSPLLPEYNMFYLWVTSFPFLCSFVYIYQ